MGGDASKQLLR